MSINIFLYWLPMIAIAIANGTLRQFFLLKHYNSLLAHQISTIILIIACAVYTWLIFPSLNIQSSQQAFLTGFVWMMLTVVFEFSLGRLNHKTWKILLEDYNIKEGRIWVVFLMSLFLLPLIVYSQRY